MPKKRDEDLLNGLMKIASGDNKSADLYFSRFSDYVRQFRFEENPAVASHFPPDPVSPPRDATLGTPMTTVAPGMRANLLGIFGDAQGGQVVTNLANQFGISLEQAQAAVQALIPALSAGLAKCANSPGALGAIISAIADPDHQASFSSPAAAQSPIAVQKGNDALTQILGSSYIVQQIAQQAARVTGLRPDLLVQMLPVIASIVLGGLATSLYNQGLGGILAQLAGAVEQGTLGSTTGSGAGVMGMLGNLLRGLFESGDTSSLNAGVTALTRMFEPGNLPPNITQSGLPRSVSTILDKAR